MGFQYSLRFFLFVLLAYVNNERQYVSNTSCVYVQVHNLTARSFAASNNRSQNSAFPGQSREFDSRRLPRS